jgi:hypothetical protein
LSVLQTRSVVNVSRNQAAFAENGRTFLSVPVMVIHYGNYKV